MSSLGPRLTGGVPCCVVPCIAGGGLAKFGYSVCGELGVFCETENCAASVQSSTQSAPWSLLAVRLGMRRVA